MIKLTKEQVLLLHSDLIKETGGTDGIRDNNLLESALNALFQVFSSGAAFPSLQQKAARLGFGLIKNHAFIDGNKRIGIHVMLTFLIINNIELKYTQEELTDIVLQIAASEKGYDDLLDWIIEHQL